MRRDAGSTFPLIIGFVSILLALTLGLSEILSLRLSQDRALADARFAAVYLARDSQDVPLVRGLDYSSVVSSLIPEATTASAVSSDGRTIEVSLCETWQSPFGLHSPANVCDQALARVNAFGDVLE